MTNAKIKQYQIANTVSGADLGIYSGATPAEALDAMARDAGYRDYADSCEATSSDGSELVVTETRAYEIHEEGNGRFATIEAASAEEALRIAAERFPCRSVDYNGFVGQVTWSAFAPGEDGAAAALLVDVA